MDNMNGHKGYYTKWNKLGKENTTWFHLCVKSKIKERKNKQNKIETNT